MFGGMYQKTTRENICKPNQKNAATKKNKYRADRLGAG